MKVLVASTIPPWKSDQGSLAWLSNAEGMVDISSGGSIQVNFFVALEYDARDAQFVKLLERIKRLRERGIDFTVWKFSLDDGADKYDSGNRLFRICIGRNAAHEFAMVNYFDAILFLDSDILPDANCIPKLLEVNHPIVGGDVKEYGMNGPKVMIEDEFKYFVSYEGGKRVHTHGSRPFPKGVHVEAHWNTAGFLMVRREVFTQHAWHYNLDKGCTDDPTFQNEAQIRFGTTWVRKDVKGTHVEPLIPVEKRDVDRTYHRV